MSDVLDVILLGHMILGGATSATCTVNIQPAVLPAASIAVQFTCVFPNENAEPFEGKQLYETLENVSVTLRLPKNTLAVAWPSNGVWVTLAGQEIIGGTLSRTVT